MKRFLVPIAAFLFAAVGLLAAGCGSGGGTQTVSVAQPATLVLNTDTVLQIGETRRIGNTNTLLRFASVTQDTRCPIDAICVSSGECDARLLVTSGTDGVGESYILSEAPSNLLIPATQNHAAYTVSLRLIQPYRQSNVMISPSDYKITVQVTPATEAQ